MARRVSWTNNSSGHLGTYVYRAPTLDPQNLPAPVATVDPVAQGATAEWIDTEELASGDYEYAVRDYDAGGEGAVSEVNTHTIPLTLDSAQPGDEVSGGIYIGIASFGGVDHHLIMAKAVEEGSENWKNSQTATSGTGSYSNGLANTNAMVAAGIADHPAAQHCINCTAGGFTDWYMPSRGEMFLVYDNISGHTEIAENAASGDNSWTSTEQSYQNGIIVRLSDRNSGTTYKNFARRVRPMRRVPV